MPKYHPDAKKEYLAILNDASGSVKDCLGMLVQRHLRMELGSEPLTAHERLRPVSKGEMALYLVEYQYGLAARVLCVYKRDSAGVTALAVDAWDGLTRVGAPTQTPAAEQRARRRA